MAIDNDRLLAAIDAGRERSYGSDQGTTLAWLRSKALDYYFGENVNPAPEGRSQVVDRAVYETLSTIIPSLVRIFSGSSEEICKAMPVGPDDEQAAELMTALLNHVVMSQNQWEQICADWIHDASLLCNGYAMAYWDESKTLIREEYKGQSDDQVAALMQDSDLTVIAHTSRVDEQATKEAQAQYEQMVAHYQQALPILQQQGQPLPPPPQPPQPIMLHDLTIEREDNAGKVCIKVLPPEHCWIDADTPDWTLSECRYFEFQRSMSIADLRAMGLDVPIDISDQDSKDFVIEDNSRNRFNENRLSEAEDYQDNVMRVVTARMIWVRADAEGDETSRMYYVLAVGRTVLYAEPTTRVMVSSMTPQPLPHRHIGMSIAETMFDVQDVKTAVTRGGLDNLYLANAGRHVISDQVNLADFLDARPGGVVRMLPGANPGDGHILPLTHPVVFDQVMGSLSYFDQVRQRRSGASDTFAGTDPNLSRQTATGTIANQNQSSYRVEHIARMMSPAVEQLFSIVQELIQKHQNKALTIKLRGKWATIDPQVWRTKRDMRISVGVGAGNRDSMFAQLESIFQKQIATSAMGLAGPPEMHATVIEQAKLAGFANPDKFWTDPSTTPPKPPQPTPEQIKAMTAKELKQMELQADAQKFQAQTALTLRQIELEAEAKAREQAMQLQVQAANDARDATREQQRAGVDAQMAALQQAAKEKDNMLALELEKYKADLDAQVKLTIAGVGAPMDALNQAVAQMTSTLMQLMEDMQAPATIVRDQAGRAVGIQRGKRQMTIARDATGRATGLQ